MKTIICLFITLSTIAGLPLTINAQTFTVTSNGDGWSTLSFSNNSIDNPTTGLTFFVTTPAVTTPATGQLVVNIFTLAGQLVMRTTVQGQTQYPVQLPSQLLPGTAVIVQTIQAEQTLSFPLPLR